MFVKEFWEEMYGAIKKSDPEKMKFNSSLYQCLVMHNRIAPKKHRFNYRIFMFWLDLDELDAVAKKSFLFGRNAFSIFNFRDTDHFKYTAHDERNKLQVKDKLELYLRENGIEKPFKVYLLTHVRMFGYVFNPVSFYFCYDEQGDCNYVVTEISNTFGEMKFFLIREKAGGKFEQTETKFFYVSPFTDMDTDFEFRYQVPGEKLNIAINVNDRGGNKFFISTLTGRKKPLNDKRLLAYIFRFPFVTLKVIGGIHWEAFRLWMKKLPFHKKTDQSDLQKGITNPGKIKSRKPA